MRTYTKVQNKTKKHKEWGSNSQVLIRPSNLDVAARTFERSFVEKQLCRKFHYCVVCVVCVRVCVCA